MKSDPIHETMKRLAKNLRSAGIDYAVIGGMALAGHGLVRFTEDVDILLTSAGLAAFVGKGLSLGYAPAFESARKTFVDVETRVRIEVATTGEYPGDGKPKAVSFPDPADVGIDIEGIKIVGLETLVALKLASGISAPHRLRDLADVQDLIARLRLPADFSDRLDPSVREAYLERWRAAQSQPKEENP
jgi:hypothetical protein